MSHRDSLLVVEDQPDQRALVTRWLSPRFEVTAAPDADAGAALAAEARFDIVLSDVQLPGGGSGLDVVRRSKQAHPWRPALLMTAHRDLDTAIGAIRMGADDFLLKPLERHAVVTKVASLVDRTRRGATRVLAIGAHPDDVEIGIGGLLARHRAAGDQIEVLTVTSGSEGGGVARRAAEAREAASMLGVALTLGELVDTRVSDGPATIQLISEAIRRFAPDIVYTHSTHDTHQDHRAVHRATLVAARSVPELFCYQSPSCTPSFAPSRFVPIDDHVEAKLALIGAYQSQTEKCAYLAPDLIRATARYWGRFAGYRLVEPLEVVRAR